MQISTMFRFIYNIVILIFLAIPVSSQINSNDTQFSYYLQNQTQSCSYSDFVCIPLVSADTLQNCIGLEMILNYNNQKVSPTSVITVRNKLVNPEYVTVSQITNSTLGTINIIVYLNSSAPDGTSFNGKGEILCVEFAKTASFQPEDTAIFTIASITESYNTGTDEVKPVGAGWFVSYRNKMLNGNIVFWSDNAPLSYYESNPSQFLPTFIYGYNSDISTSVFPDIAGEFIYNADNGLNFTIHRNIVGTTNVQSVVNGYDALLLARLLVGEDLVDFNIYQLLAMDVNLDGKISSGDLSQISQRSVRKIDEFKQAWNYNDTGIKIVNIPSRDWVFIDLNRIQNNPSFRKSSIYPGDDGTGFSRYRIPFAPDRFEVPLMDNNDCTILLSEKYFGIMLGDINGNYKYISPDGKLKSSSESNTSESKIIVDLTKAIFEGDLVKIPVYANADVNLGSIDMGIRFHNENNIFQHIETEQSLQSDYYYSKDDKTLRFTSWTLKYINQQEPVLWLYSSNLGFSDLTKSLTHVTAFVNGNESAVFVMDNKEKNESESQNLRVFPIPAHNTLSIETYEPVHFRLINSEGNCLKYGITNEGNIEFAIDIQNVKPGIYFLEITNTKVRKTFKVIKQ